MLPLSPRICQCMRRCFVKRPKFLAATSNLRVEQSLVHLGRFLHFSQKAKRGWSNLKAPLTEQQLLHFPVS